MTRLCDECETVAHCIKHGCIPKQQALDKKAENALEQPAQKCSYPYCGCNSKAWCKVERNEALDKKAENARELGLDYEPAQQEPVYFCDYGYEGWGKVDAAMAAENIACGMTVEAYYTRPQAREPLTDEQQIAEALRRHGLTLIKTASGYDALKLSQIDAHGIKEQQQ